MSTETAKTEGTEYKPTHAVRTAANMTGYYGTGTCYESAMEAMLDAMGDQSHYAKPENFTFFNVTGKVYSNGDIEGDRISMNDKEKKEISNIWEIMFLGVAVDHCEQLLQILKTKQGYDKHLSEIERMLNDLDAAREKLGY